MARALVLACNTIKKQNMQQLEGLITLSKSLFVYKVWIVPAGMENAVKERLLRADQCLANVVIGNAKEAEA